MDITFFFFPQFSRIIYSAWIVSQPRPWWKKKKRPSRQCSACVFISPTPDFTPDAALKHSAAPLEPSSVFNFNFVFERMTNNRTSVASLPVTARIHPLPQKTKKWRCKKICNIKESFFTGSYNEKRKIHCSFCSGWYFVFKACFCLGCLFTQDDSFGYMDTLEDCIKKRKCQILLRLLRTGC